MFAQVTRADWKELAELAGYTSRVSDLLDTMEEVKAGNYQKKLVSSSNVGENAKSTSGRASITDVPVLQGRGQIIESDEIRFDQVPLISPNGDVLVKSMSFNVEKGVSLRELATAHTNMLRNTFSWSDRTDVSGGIRPLGRCS